MNALNVMGAWMIGTIAVVSALCFYSSCRSADIYNHQNNTNYSCGDFFWASEQINSQTQTIKLKN